MVSQPSHSTDLALRGPSSVVSSRHSRRHGRGRSHAGGSSYVPQNEFPVFTHTGDVEILVKAGSQTNRYLLHRLILTQCSRFFEASTSQEWSRATEEVSGELARIGEDSGSESARRETKKRWRYELDPGANEDDIPMLVQKEGSSGSIFGASDARPPPVRNKPPSSNGSFFRSVANLTLPSSHSAPPAPPISQEDQDLLNDYDNLLRIFYNYSPSLDSIDIAVAYVQCKALLTLADLYDALAVVGPRIDHHLLQFNSRLWKQIAKYPSSYLKLGYLAQSKIIFQEALIHVVGAWPMGERHIRHQLPDAVLEIIEDKVEDLADMTGKIEGRLFRLSLTTSRGERVTPNNSYLEWLVVSLFRQWLADNTSLPPTPVVPTGRTSQSRNGPGSGSSGTNGSSQNSTQLTPLPPPPTTTSPNLGRVYRILGSSTTSYLGHDECKRFLKLSPEFYSRETLKKFERRLDELKTMARDIVRPLMRSSLLGEGSSTSYLVCSKIDDPRDFPWLESTG